MAQSRSLRHASLHPSIVESSCRHLSVLALPARPPALTISPRLICNAAADDDDDVVVIVTVIGLTYSSGCHLSSPTLLVTTHPHPYSRVPGENSAPLRFTRDTRFRVACKHSGLIAYISLYLA